MAANRSNVTKGSCQVGEEVGAYFFPNDTKGAQIKAKRNLASIDYS